jgi:hypothetical protein
VEGPQQAKAFLPAKTPGICLVSETDPVGKLPLSPDGSTPSKPRVSSSTRMDLHIPSSHTTYKPSGRHPYIHRIVCVSRYWFYPSR